MTDPFDLLMAETVRKRPADERPMRACAEGIQCGRDLRAGHSDRDDLRAEYLTAGTPRCGQSSLDDGLGDAPNVLGGETGA